LTFVFVDPALLALPNGLAEDADELAVLVDRVVDLATWARECCAFVLIKPHDIEGDLISSGAFPDFQIVKETLETYGLSNVFTTKDVLVSLLTIMERASSIIDIFGIDVSQSTVAGMHLVSIFDRFPLNVRAMSINALASVCLLKSLGKITDDGFAISGHPLLGRQTLVFAGRVQEITTSGKFNVVIPISVTGDIRLLDSPRDVLDFGEAIGLWRSAQNAADIHVALESRVRELMSSDARLQRTVERFSLGSEFVQSLKDSQAFGSGAFASTVMDVCARIIAASPKYEVNDFGQRSTDGAQGKRTHATKHRPALRLLFWVLTDGQVEFANVGQKNDLEIEAGKLGGRMLIQYPG
jgi:hypothetical protein